MASGDQLVNAWILLSEDDPAGVPYDNPQSAFQALIKNNVYSCVDILFLCFVTTVATGSDTVPTGDGSSFTVQIQPALNPPHPGGLTNQQYMNWVLRDAKNNNPDIKFMVTLDWGTKTVLQNIFSNKNHTDQQNADNFADNLMAYLKGYGLDGFDMDWESPAYCALAPEQFAMLLKAIRARFDQETGKHYLLTLSPDATFNLDAATVNSCVDFLNLQLYADNLLQQEFIDFNVQADLLAYGAKFEADGPNDPIGHQSAQDAYEGYVAGGYKVITQWRLNSGNFPFEQENQKQLYSLIFPKTE
jgi:hypothetical protein